MKSLIIRLGALIFTTLSLMPGSLKAELVIEPSAVTVAEIKHLSGCLDTVDGEPPLCPEPATEITFEFSVACYQTVHDIFYSISYKTDGVLIAANVMLSSDLEPMQAVCAGFYYDTKTIQIAGLYDEDQIRVKNLVQN